MTVGVKKQFLREARDGMLSLDPVGSPAVLRTLDLYLQEYDSSKVDFTTLEEYLPYRIPNAGYRCVILFFFEYLRTMLANIMVAESAAISLVGLWTFI